MGQEATERLSTVTGLAAVGSVAVVVLIGALTGQDQLTPAQPVVWWTLYAVYVLTFLALDERVPGVRRLHPDLLLLLLIATGLGTWWFSPDLGWTAIVLVVTASTAAFIWPPRRVGWVVMGQTAVIAVGTVAAGLAYPFVLLSVLAFGTFQAFAALVVHALRREAEARRELAATHADLRAATALLDRTSRDAERLRIARDLHDVVGHQLTALAVELEVAGHLTSGPAGEHVARARKVAKDLLVDVRSTVGRLREETNGLSRMLDSVATDLPGLDVELAVDEQVPVETAAAVAVVRCVQEAVTNTIRHAGARRLKVTVVSDAAGIRVDAVDDGRGAATIDVGNGLAGMRERFESLGGNVAFTSAVGQGFSLTARLPAPRVTAASTVGGTAPATAVRPA